MKRMSILIFIFLSFVAGMSFEKTINKTEKVQKKNMVPSKKIANLKSELRDCKKKYNNTFEVLEFEGIKNDRLEPLNRKLTNDLAACEEKLKITEDDLNDFDRSCEEIFKKILENKEKKEEEY